jgi:hypothetical protein
MDVEARAIFAKLDGDGDGNLSPLELVAGRAATSKGPGGSHRTPWHPFQAPLDPLQIGAAP